MATGRTVNRWVRAYIDGYDMSGYSRGIGPLLWQYAQAEVTAEMSDAAKGYLPGKANINPGALNGLFDNTASSGLHVIASSIQQSRALMIPLGIRAAPADGDPVFVGQFLQLGYNGEAVEGSGVYANIPFSDWDISDLIAYDQPWGNLVHAKGAETAANSTAAFTVDGGAASGAGGWLMYHVFAGNGTATISIDDSADDSSYSALSGATSGEIDCSSVQSDIVALGVTATVRQYLRWQLSLNTATTVTFALAFVRGN